MALAALQTGKRSASTIIQRRRLLELWWPCVSAATATTGWPRGCTRSSQVKTCTTLADNELGVDTDAMTPMNTVSAVPSASTFQTKRQQASQHCKPATTNKRPEQKSGTSSETIGWHVRLSTASPCREAGTGHGGTGQQWHHIKPRLEDCHAGFMIAQSVSRRPAEPPVDPRCGREPQVQVVQVVQRVCRRGLPVGRQDRHLAPGRERHRSRRTAPTLAGGAPDATTLLHRLPPPADDPEDCSGRRGGERRLAPPVRPPSLPACSDYTGCWASTRSEELDYRRAQEPEAG